MGESSSLAQQAFVRGAALPAWACPAPSPAPAADEGRATLVVRWADTQLWAGERPSTLVHRCEQVHDTAALGQIGQVSLPFNPHYQRLLLHRALIHRGGERIDHTASVPVRFLQRESGLEQGVVSGVVTATMVLPDVRSGDMLELLYTVEGENPIFGQRYAGWAGWDQSHAVERRRVILASPEGRRIHWRWIGDRPIARPEPVEHTEHGVRRLQWNGEHLAPVPFEAYLPRDAQPFAWLQFSEFDDWQQVARWAAEVFPLDEPLPDELHALVRDWQALPDDEARAGAALRWVQKEIRYYSVSLGENSHRPERPAEVLRRRYGDCKEKSLLLAMVLRALGLDAHPALVAARTRSLPLRLWPSPEAFDHVIVRLQIGGRVHWLDATRAPQPAALPAVGQGMEDAAALVISAEATTLETVHADDPATHFGNELSERWRFDPPGEGGDGSGLLESQQHWHGLGAESLHAMLARMGDTELAHWALARYERRYPGTTLVGRPVLHHDLERNRFTATVRLRVPHVLQEHQGRRSLAYSAANLHGAFVVPESLARTLPLAVPTHPGRLHYELDLEWPEGLAALDGPMRERLQTPHFELAVEREAHERRLRLRLTLQPLQRAVPAAELTQLARDLRRLDGWLQGHCSACDRSATPGLQARLAAHWHRQVDRLSHTLAHQPLPAHERASALCLRAQAWMELGAAQAALRDANEAITLAAHPAAWTARGKAHWALGRLDEAEADFERSLQVERF